MEGTVLFSRVSFHASKFFALDSLMVVENMPWCGESNGYGKDTVLKEINCLKWRSVAILSLFGGNNCKMRKADTSARATSIEKKKSNIYQGPCADVS